MKAKNGGRVWKAVTSQSGNVLASPAVANGVLYIAAEDNNLYAFDAATGAQLRKVAVDAFISSPAISNGRVFIGSLDHKVLAFGLP